MGFTINVHVSVDLSASAREWIMSIVSDAVAELKTSVESATSRILTETDGFKAQIADLTAKLAAGGLSVEEQTAIATDIRALKAQVDAIDPTNATTLASAGQR